MTSYKGERTDLTENSLIRCSDARLYTEEGRDHFTVRDNVLGHSQQGGTPSTFDRNMSTKLAAKTVTWLVEQLDHFASLDGRTRL